MHVFEAMVKSIQKMDQLQFANCVGLRQPKREDEVHTRICNNVCRQQVLHTYFALSLSFAVSHGLTVH